MRPLLCAALLALPALAEDLVHLRHGGVLRGEVVRETAAAVSLDLGSGVLEIPRERIRLVERHGTGRPARKVVTQKDEWFLVLHRGKVVGWRRLVHTEGPNRVQVEERTVFFRPGGGDDVEIRRVEAADGEGRPVEFLLMERYGDGTEIVNGQCVDGRALVQLRRDGRLVTRDLELPEGWVLGLPAWARFLDEAKPGEARTLDVLDLGRLRAVKVLLRRDADAPAPDDPGVRPCRAIQLVEDVRTARAFYRPGEGSVAMELNGASLVAKRVSPERVEMARRAHAAPRHLTVQEAWRYPFVERPKDLVLVHDHAGIAVRAPDAGWIPTQENGAQGLVVSFEKIAIFASVEVSVYPAGAADDADRCLDRALARLRLAAREVRPAGPPERCVVDGQPARVVRFAADHRGEQLEGLLAVIRANGRYALVVGAAPARWMRWAEKDFRAFVDGIEIAN